MLHLATLAPSTLGLLRRIQSQAAFADGLNENHAWSRDIGLVRAGRAGQGLRPHGARQAQSGFMWHIRWLKEDCHV